MNVVILTGCNRCSILVDVRILLEVIDRDTVDVNRGLGVSTATSGRIATFTVVVTIVVAITIVRVCRQHGCAGKGCGGGSSRRDVGNQMTDATSVRPLMLEKLFRCRHVRNRAYRYGCVQYFVVCIQIFIVFILLRHIVNFRNTFRFIFASFVFVCTSFLSATTASAIVTISAPSFVQLLSVDQFHRDKLLQSL